MFGAIIIITVFYRLNMDISYHQQGDYFRNRRLLLGFLGAERALQRWAFIKEKRKISKLFFSWSIPWSRSWFLTSLHDLQRFFFSSGYFVSPSDMAFNSLNASLLEILVSQLTKKNTFNSSEKHSFYTLQHAMIIMARMLPGRTCLACFIPVHNNISQVLVFHA